ncbi:MAG: aldo/keto reductase [Candidatus Woesebacteria bacterium]|nr:MAG: aldo/keto reductase [Candidatus Woesebacteria bacterium]
MTHNKVGLGTFPLSSVFNPITPNEAEKLVRKFIDEGGCYIDTAPLYGNGEIEKILGKVFKSVPREKFYLITKTVKHVDEYGQLFKSGKYEDVVKQIDNSLSRLGLDYVDCLMVHSPDKDVPIEETLRAMEKLQNDGKVKELAVSNVNLNELMEYNKTGKIRYVENSFSMINHSISSELEEYLLNNKISLIPYHLLEIGLLTGIAFENFKLSETDLRNKVPYWNQENQKVIFEWVRNSLAPIAKKLGITIGQLNIAWALQQPFIDFIIVGTTKPKYLEINLKANDIELSKETLSEIDEAYNVLEQKIKSDYGKSIREFRGLNEKFY